jgi:hypothetical protein
VDSTKKKIISRVIIVFIGLVLAILGCIAAINHFSNQKSIRIEKSKISGGKPWINSNIKENISTNTAIDPKDDFHLYVNKEWILKNTIPEGYSSWSYYQERALEVKKQGINLLKDKSIEGHDNKVCSIKKVKHPKYGECLLSQGLEEESIILWAIDKS